MSSEKPLVYLILGTAGSGRRTVVSDLIDGSLDETEKTAVMVCDSEKESPVDAKLPALSRWTWTGEFIVGSLPPGMTRVFFISEGRSNPVDQIEVFKPWLEAQGGELARIICVVDCQLAEKNPALLAWFDACVHFADVVLLNRREGVANKWLSDFQTHYKSQYLPCLFELVKADRVKNPGLVLDPQARRMTHIFEADQEWVFTDAEGQEIDEEEETEGDEEVEAKEAVDPYFARHNGGRRVKEIPDLAKFLPPA